MLQEVKPDVLVVDIEMPVLDGPELLKLIRQKNIHDCVVLLFSDRSHAELAKEAMSNQALDHAEVLDVRWAHDDPNPVAKQAAKRANADAVLALKPITEGDL